MGNPILGREFVQKLQAAGLLPDGVRRVVIDASHDKPLTIYIEKIGDERWLEIDVTEELRPAIVVTGDDEEGVG